MGTKFAMALETKHCLELLFSKGEESCDRVGQLHRMENPQIQKIEREIGKT